MHIFYIKTVFFQMVDPVAAAAARGGFVHMNALGRTAGKGGGAESQGSHQAEGKGVSSHGDYLSDVDRSCPS